MTAVVRPRKEVEEIPVVTDESQPENADESRGSDVEAFNDHVKALVENFVLGYVQELEQRIRDLEMVVGEAYSQKEPASPYGTIQFGDNVPSYAPVSQDGRTGWYQPPEG